MGEGIAGMTVAYLLAREGRSVVLIDKNQVGSGETSRASAHLSSEIDASYRRIEHLHGDKGARLVAQSDLVQAFFLQPNLFRLQNVGDVRNSGFEAEWRVRPTGDFQGSIGYSYLHRATVSTPPVPLLNTPNNKMFGYIAYRGIPRVRLVGSLNTESSRLAQDDPGLLLTLPSYATVSAKAALSLYTGLDVEVSGLNLLNHNYALYPGFPEAGRVGLVQLRYRF